MKKITSLLVLCIFILSSGRSGQTGEKSDKDDVFKKLALQLCAAEKKMKNKTVAIFGFDMIGRGDDTYTKYATEKLTHELVKTGTFLVIERSRIDKVLKEQELSLSGSVDASTAAQIGKILAVEGVIIGTITVENNEVEYMARVVQSETALILASADERYVAKKIAASDQVGETANNEGGKNSSAGLSLTKKAYEANQAVTVEFSGMPGNQYDWLTLVQASDPDSYYREWFYTKGLKQGSHTFNGVSAGTYEIRAYYDWPNGGYIVQKRITFEVK